MRDWSDIIEKFLLDEKLESRKDFYKRKKKVINNLFETLDMPKEGVLKLTYFSNSRITEKLRENIKEKVRKKPDHKLIPRVDNLNSATNIDYIQALLVTEQGKDPTYVDGTKGRINDIISLEFALVCDDFPKRVYLRMPCKIEDAVMLGEIYDDIKITSYFKNEIEWNPAKTDLEGATETMKNSIPGKISYKFDLQFDGGKVEYDNFHTQGQDLFLTLHRFTPEAEQVITQLGINLQGANK